eukprot:951150-Amorphochlora_amoeboformis.AAC.1
MATTTGRLLQLHAYYELSGYFSWVLWVHCVTCCHASSKAWYYLLHSPPVTTWYHPLLPGTTRYYRAPLASTGYHRMRRPSPHNLRASLADPYRYDDEGGSRSMTMQEGPVYV